ncbi:MAG TPA: four helix bundle protein [Patescibacteria group bacterium]
MGIESYQDLVVWQKGIELSVKIYELTKSFFKSELYGLTSQMRRASVSIPSNIAEGYCQHSRKSYLKYIYRSLGSVAELETQIIIAKRAKLIKESEDIDQLIKEIFRMLLALIKKLK